MIATNEWLYLAEMIGIVVFSISGALAAQGKRLDIFGVIVLGLVTALGGGTLRDVSLNAYPLVWIGDTAYLWVAMASAVSAFILCRFLSYPRRTLLVFDGLGLALFSVLGAQKAESMGVPATVIVIMGVMTGCAGGLIRDLLTQEIPLILNRTAELYATCALGGCLFYVLSDGLISPDWRFFGAILIVFVLRLAALFTGLRLPEFIVAGHALESNKEARGEEKE